MQKSSDISIFDLRANKVSKKISISDFNIPQGNVTFDMDRDMNRLFIGDGCGEAKIY